MPRTGPIKIDEIVLALELLGGEAKAKDIKDKVTELRGGMPSHPITVDRTLTEKPYRRKLKIIVRNRPTTEMQMSRILREFVEVSIN